MGSEAMRPGEKQGPAGLLRLGPIRAGAMEAIRGYGAYEAYSGYGAVRT
jgi:hypothetical protein